jgi:hypothetical protein
MTSIDSYGSTIAVILDIKHSDSCLIGTRDKASVIGREFKAINLTRQNG